MSAPLVRSDGGFRPAEVRFLVACVTILLGSFWLTGCSKSGRAKEPPISGRASDPAVELRAEWRPGWRYHLRLEVTETTETHGDPDSHEVSLAHEYAVTVTNVMPNGNRGLELETLSLEMQRSKGTSYTLVYDSAAEKAYLDEYGYAEALNKMVGRRLRYLLSPSNTVLRVDGMRDLIPSPPGRPSGSNTSVKVGAEPQNQTAARSPLDRRRNTVVNSLRDIFDNDYFKQLVELDGLPPGPVRIGESWPWQRPFSARPMGRLTIDATNSFRGWQMRAYTNCARLEANGMLTGGQARSPMLRLLPDPAKGTNQPIVKEPSQTVTNTEFKAVAWLNPSLAMLLERQLYHRVPYPSSRSFRLEGTNSVTERVSKTLHQATVFKVVAVTPHEPEKAP